MVCCRVFACRELAIVAAFAVGRYAAMIKHTGGKAGRDMAHGTIVCGGNMIHWFASS